MSSGCPALGRPFPTRRSSDLSAVCRGSIRRIVKPLSSMASWTNVVKGTCNAYFLEAIDDNGFTILLDRKSTRLNSSHSQISYAVFCLNKKNRTHLAKPFIKLE